MEATGHNPLSYNNILRQISQIGPDRAESASYAGSVAVLKSSAGTIALYDGIKIDPEFLRWFKGKTIEVVGMPGSGKSTAAKLLSNFLTAFNIETHHFEEHIEDEIFDPMLDDPKEYAFLYQYVMIKHRLAVRENAQKALVQNPSACVVIDGGLLTDLSFAVYHVTSGNINKKSFEIYSQKISNNSHKLTIPDVILQINCDYDTLCEKLKIRHRTSEIRKDGTPKYDKDFYDTMSSVYEYVQKLDLYAQLADKHVDFNDSVIIPKDNLYKIGSENKLLKNMLKTLYQHYAHASKK